MSLKIAWSNARREEGSLLQSYLYHSILYSAPGEKSHNVIEAKIRNPSVVSLVELCELSCILIVPLRYLAVRNRIVDAHISQD